MSQHESHGENTGLFFYLFALTALLCLWQQSFLVYTKDSYFVIDAVMAKLFIVPFRVYATIALYWCLQLGFHLLFVLVIGEMAYLSAAQLKLSRDAIFKWGIFLWVAGVFAIFLANAVRYPLSAFSELVNFFVPRFLTGACLAVVLLPLGGAFVLSGIRIIHLTRKHIKVRWGISIGLIVCLGVAVSFWVRERSLAPSYERAKHKQPNIFIIGLDAIRPERLGFNGYKNHTPYIDQFLKQSTVFSYSLTPLARTYPAWVSIITGLYPKHHGVRFTLTDPRGSTAGDYSLATLLKKQGYRTLFATDGSRFNVMNRLFGFEQTIGPEPGVNNFIMDFVDGSPLLNLLINTEIGMLLYPNIIGNRDVVFTYDPQKFVQVLERQIPPESDQPIFAGIHLNLTHYPYEWAASLPGRHLHNSVLYDMSIERVDYQFRSLMEFLKNNHYLDNAIVFLMSDHGDAFCITGDRWITEKKYIKGVQSDPDIFRRLNALQPDNKRIDVTSGHGTDVLSFSQYHNLLAVQFYGFKKNAKKTVSDLASLIDIKPTIVDALHLPYQKTDGISLLPYTEGKSFKQTSPRKLFVEIDFTPVAIRSADVSMQNVILQGIDMFEIMPGSQEIIMKPSMFKRLLKTKQKGLYYGDWLIGLYPDEKDRLYPVLVNCKTGSWTDDLSTSFAKNSPADEMVKDLKQFYGKEMTDYWHR